MTLSKITFSISAYMRNLAEMTFSIMTHSIKGKFLTQPPPLYRPLYGEKTQSTWDPQSGANTRSRGPSPSRSEKSLWLHSGSFPGCSSFLLYSKWLFEHDGPWHSILWRILAVFHALDKAHRGWEEIIKSRQRNVFPWIALLPNEPRLFPK